MKGVCDNWHTMRKPTRSCPISDVLREALERSEVPLLTLQQATGVARASIMRFLRGERTLRLDNADKLANYLGLELTKKKGK